MATIPKSVETRLDADWTGAGGAEPAYYLQEEDFRTPPPLGEDSVWIMSKTLATGAKPVNDKFVNEEHVLRLIVNTPTDADRLKELSDEVVRILNATAITDITYQRMKTRNRTVTEYQGIWVYQEIITYDLREQMKSSAAAYGASAVSIFTVDELTINTWLKLNGYTVTDILDEDNMASDSETALVTQQSIKAYIDKANMIGSANAVWMPMSFLAENTPGKITVFGGFISNVDGTDLFLDFTLPLPANKVGLKLHITGARLIVNDADVNNYVTTIFIVGVTETGSTGILTDTTNRTAQGDYEYTLADTDVSVYDYVSATIQTTVLNANNLDFGPLLLLCYYDT